MKKNNKLLAFICAAATAASGLTLSMPYNVFADATKVVSIGNDLTDAQKKTMLKYFGIEGDQSVQRINVTNKDEISHLSSYIPLEQIGTRTVSCAYIKPTESGGIRVRTANLQYVTANMIASTLADLGIKNCEVVSACPFQVSGTGALTGIIMAYETATGETIDKAKKDIATQEVVVTKDLAKDIVNENYDNSYTENITEINNNIKQEIDASDDIDIDVDIEDTNTDDDEELVPDDSITENLDDSLLGDNVIASSTDDASLIVDTAESSESTEESTESEDVTVEETGETDGDASDDTDTTDIENDESETAPNGDVSEPEETSDDEDDESTESETSEASDTADDANTDTDADSDTETETDTDADIDADGDTSDDAEKTCDSVEDGKDLDDIVIPEDGLSYFGYDINAIKDASDENTAKRFLQLENNMKEAFPFSLGNYADCLLNQGKLLDSETGEPLENVDESKLMSHITKYILATYENYILTRPTESLQSEFDDTIKSEIDDGSIQPEDEEKVREIISHARTPIAKPAEATNNSAPDETATDDEAVSLEDILG